MNAARLKAGDAVAGGPSLLPDERILELLPTAVCVCDTEGLILRYNRKAAEIWGRSPPPGDPGQRFCGAYRLLQADGRPLAGRRTPMAEVLRTGRPARDLELLVERPGGRRLAILMDVEPVRTESGELAGAICSFKEAGRHLRAPEPRGDGWEPFRTIVDATPECVKIVARDGRLLYMNAAGLQMIEAGRADGVTGAATFALIAPEHRDDWERHHARVCDGEKLSWEFDIVGLHGKRLHMETHAVPLPMPDGTVAHLAVTRDVTQRRQAEERRQLLINELNHRVKNTLATVQSIAAQSFRAQAEEEARRWFEGRLGALSNAHDVLTRESWEGAGLREIVEKAVAPFRNRGGNRLATGGPDLRLTPKMALSLSLALHELCINAARHGALSDADGSVALDWRVVRADEVSRLRLTWTERGGPPVEPPRRRGFGFRLLERGLVHELGADVRLDYAPAGLACEIDTPLAPGTRT